MSAGLIDSAPHGLACQDEVSAGPSPREVARWTGVREAFARGPEAERPDLVRTVSPGGGEEAAERQYGLVGGADPSDGRRKGRPGQDLHASRYGRHEKDAL